MSEKKEFNPLDVGATERVDWKVAQGLNKNVHFDENGNVEIGKNLQVKSGVFTLKNKESGFMPVKIVRDGSIVESGFILSDSLPTLESDRSNLYVSGLWLNLSNDQSGICPILENFKPNSPNTNIVDGVLFIDEGDEQAFASLFKAFATSGA